MKELSIRCINDGCALNYSCKTYSKDRKSYFDVKYEKFIPQIEEELYEIECSHYVSDGYRHIPDSDGGL